MIYPYENFIRDLPLLDEVANYKLSGKFIESYDRSSMVRDILKVNKEINPA